ncbi:hypothetical protein ABBQ32_012883 [Trebouxia sp. C0010 RCD-2024]
MRTVCWGQVSDHSQQPESWNEVDVDDSADKAEVKRQVLHDGSCADSPELRLLSEGGAWRKWENCQTLPAGNLKVKVISQQPDTLNDAAWRLEVTESLKALRNQSSKAMVPQDFSRVGSTQANRVLASLEIVETVGNEIDPIVLNELAPASRDFDFSEYVNKNAGTLDLLKHHQVELIKFGVKFGGGAFTMYDLHDHQNPIPIVHDGQEYHVVLMEAFPHMA